MMDMSDVQSKHESIIAALLTQEAAFRVRWKRSLEEIKEKIETSQLKYLDVSKDVISHLDWSVNHMANTKKLIDSLQEYVEAILDLVDYESLSDAAKDDKIDKLEIENETLKKQLAEVENKLVIVSDSISRGSEKVSSVVEKIVSEKSTVDKSDDVIGRPIVEEQVKCVVCGKMRNVSEMVNEDKTLCTYCVSE